MGIARGQRQTERSKTAVINAFTELLREQSYQTITIQDIVGRANTGRSTFYRYFQSKADIIVEMHKGIFIRVKVGPTSANEWLATDPPPQLVEFLALFRQTSTAPFYSSAALGADADYVMRQMDALLSRCFEESLHRSFEERQSTIPFALLAQSIAATYSWFSRAAMQSDCVYTPLQFAESIRRLSRAMLREALGI